MAVLQGVAGSLKLAVYEIEALSRAVDGGGLSSKCW